jgi:uncharacterized protein with HEPN domain
MGKDDIRDWAAGFQKMFDDERQRRQQYPEHAKLDSYTQGGGLSVRAVGEITGKFLLWLKEKYPHMIVREMDLDVVLYEYLDINPTKLWQEAAQMEKEIENEQEAIKASVVKETKE